MRVAVAGAGIAGLTTAIALAARGIQVDIFERAQLLTEIGAGIQLSPNATSVLRRLDVVEHLRGLTTPSAIEIGNGRTGRLLTSIPLGETALRRYGSPYCLIHRSDLQAGLLEAARRSASIDLHLGAEVHEIRATAHGVTLKAGGRTFLADILVAADGLHSRVRTGLFGYPDPLVTGRTAWRASLRMEAVPNDIYLRGTGLWMSPDAHLVHYPVSAGATLNVVVIGASRDSEGLPADRFHPKLRRLLTASAEWTAWPILTIGAGRSWSADRVILVGDAAHAMLPSGAQGGAQAIEDGWTLAACLAAHPVDPIPALARFQAMRRIRVGRIASQARRNLAIYGLGGLAAVARDAALTVLPPSWHLRRLDWLYGWTASEIC